MYDFGLGDVGTKKMRELDLRFRDAGTKKVRIVEGLANFRPQTRA